MTKAHSEAGDNGGICEGCNDPETKHQFQCVIDSPHCIALKSNDSLAKSADVEGGNLLNQNFGSIAQNLNNGSHGRLARCRRGGSNQHHRSR